jgi:transcriptional regulator with XRE-family HTH domain
VISMIKLPMKLALGPILAKKGMTQSALADAVDVQKGFMSEIISHKKSPSLETLFRIAEVLNVGIGDLFQDAAAHQRSVQVAKDQPGLADEAVPFEWQGFREKTRSADAITAAQVMLRHPATYRLKIALPWLALLAGDILICDLAAPQSDGDMILVGVTDHDGFNARTLVRRAKGHLALSADPEETDPVLDLRQDHRAAWRGTVRSVVRLFE